MLLLLLYTEKVYTRLGETLQGVRQQKKYIHIEKKTRPKKKSFSAGVLILFFSTFGIVNRPVCYAMDLSNTQQQQQHPTVIVRRLFFFHSIHREKKREIQKKQKKKESSRLQVTCSGRFCLCKQTRKVLFVYIQ